MKQYVRSDGIQAEAIQFKSTEAAGNEGIFELLTMLHGFGQEAKWADAESTDEWVENEETGEPEEVIIPERIILAGDTCFVNDYFVKRDGDIYVMAEELFESIWSPAITTDLDEWEWYPSQRLPYSRKVGYWQHKENEDVVSTDGGLTYFLLSERPRYQLHGDIHLSVIKIGQTR